MSEASVLTSPPALIRAVPAPVAAAAEVSLTVTAAAVVPAAGASVAEVWSHLGRTGVLDELYVRNALEWRLVPDALRGLLTAVDARSRTGVTLAVCVQAASAVPLLQSGAIGSRTVAAVLDDVASGAATVALAATDDAATGSDLVGLGTTVIRHGHALELHGGKRWITNATGCDYLLTLVRNRPGRHFTCFDWVLVPAHAPGVHIEPAGTDLFDGSGIGHVRFDGVRLPSDHLVGRPGRALATFSRHLTRERLAGALWTVAMVGRALEDTRRLLRERRHDGEPLWNRDDLRHRFAAAVTEVYGLDALTRETEERVLSSYDPAAAAVVKVAAAGVAERALGVCAGLQGADGYLPGGAQQLRAEAGVFGIGGGTVDLMLDTIADHTETLLDGVRS